MNSQLFAGLMHIDEWLRDILSEEKKRELYINLLLLRKISLEYEEESLDNQNFHGDYGRDELKWQFILQNKDNPDLKRIIEEMIFAYINLIPQLQGVIKPESIKVDIERRQLFYIIEFFSEIPQNRSNKNSEFGELFEFIIDMFWGRTSSSQEGEFFAPQSVMQLLIQTLQPMRGKIYDPNCGSGGMLIHAAKSAKKNGNDAVLYGQTGNEEIWKLSKRNIYIHNVEVDLGTGAADIFFDDQLPELKADIIIGNPPFGQRDWGWDRLYHDSRWKYGIPPKNNGTFAWVQNMLYHSNEQGRMGIILSMSPLFSRNKSEEIIRMGLIKDDLIDGIIQLPTGLFYNTRIPVSLWLMNKCKNHECRGKVLFINASELGSIEGKQTILKEEALRKIADTFETYQQGICNSISGFCTVASLNDIEHHEYTLSPDAYIEKKKAEMPTEQELNDREQDLVLQIRELCEKNMNLVNDILNEK